MTTLQSKINEQNQIARQIVSLNSDIDKMYNNLRNLPSGGFITDKETYLRQDIEEAESEVRRLENERDRLSNEVANPTVEEIFENLVYDEDFTWGKLNITNRLKMIKYVKSVCRDKLSTRHAIYLAVKHPKLFLMVFYIHHCWRFEVLELAVSAFTDAFSATYLKEEYSSIIHTWIWGTRKDMKKYFPDVSDYTTAQIKAVAELVRQQHLADKRELDKLDRRICKLPKT